MWGRSWSARRDGSEAARRRHAGGRRRNVERMCDMAERVLNCPARNGIPEGIEEFPEELDNPAVATAAGLAHVFRAS